MLAPAQQTINKPQQIHLRDQVDRAHHFSVRSVVINGLVLLLCAACSGRTPETDIDFGVPDLSVTRPGPIARTGSPVGSGGISPDAPYAPGDRVDLGSVDVVLEGPEFTHAGVTVAMPGDMDGDGFAEMVVSNSLLVDEGSRVRHAVHFLYGKTNLDPTQLLDDADATLLTPWADGGGGDQPQIASAGDIDDDGLADLLVGLPSFGEFGEVYIVYGSNIRLAGEVLLVDIAVQLTDGVEGGRFGARVAGLGDVNGDGPHDIGIVALGNDAAGDATALHVFYGTSERIGGRTPADAVLRARDGGPAASWLAPAGNINADDYDDFLVQGAGGRSAYLVMGSKDRLFGELVLDDIGSRLDGTATTGAGVGDLDTDGLSDFVVGTYSSIVGRLFHGDSTRYPAGFTAEDASAELRGAGPTGWMTLAAAGDTNGDGAPDFAIGLPNAGDQRGAVLLMLGDGTRLAGTVDLSARAVTFLGRGTAGDSRSVPDNAGASIGAGHDVNGDGLDDLIVGAPSSTIGDRAGGRAYVIFGR